MKKYKGKPKVMWLVWEYTKHCSPVAKDSGPVISNGKVLKMYLCHFRRSLIGKWVSKYAAVVTEDANVICGHNGIASETELRNSVPVIGKNNTGPDKAMRRAKRFVEGKKRHDFA